MRNRRAGWYISVITARAGRGRTPGGALFGEKSGMKDSDWIILDELYKNPNITKVAAGLYITQPTLTKRLQAMEEEFQIRIVNRSTKGVEFTKEGAYLAERARLYIRFMKETVRGIDGFKTNGYGTVRLASSFTYSRLQLSEVLMAYKQEHPNICFEIQNLRSHELNQLVEDGEADAAFVRGNYGGSARRHLILRERAYVLSKEPVDMRRLPELPMVHCRLSNYTRRLMDQWWQQNFACPPTIGAVAEDVDTCLRLAQNGLGYTLGFLAEEQLKEMEMHCVPILGGDGSYLERETWFIYNEQRPRPEYVDAFIQYVVEHYAIEN